MKPDEWCLYREGVTLPGADEHGTFVEAGLRIPVTIKEQIPGNTRVTLKFVEGAEEASKDGNSEIIEAEPVNPNEPREESGYYWGFNVRKAGSLSDVFTECPYDGGYDITVGTSERGVPVEELYSVGNSNICWLFLGELLGWKSLSRMTRSFKSWVLCRPVMYSIDGSMSALGKEAGRSERRKLSG